MAWKEKRGLAWVIKGRIDGKRVPYKTLYGTEEEAQLVADDYTLREKEEKQGFRRKGSSRLAPVGVGPKFEDWAPDYLEWYGLRFPRSIKKVRNHLNAVMPFFGSLRIAEGQEDIWTDAWNQMELELSRTHLPSSIDCFFRTLGAAMNRAARKGGATKNDKKNKRWNLVEHSPIADLGYLIEEESTERHHFSQDELDALYKADPNNPNWRMFANTGLRTAEICHQLTALVGDEQIRVSHNPREGRHVKSKKGRIIPLSPGAQEARERILWGHDGGEFFFRQQHPQTWNKQLYKGLRKAGIEKGSMHSFRHTFITIAANNPGIAINNVRLWAGHSDLAITQAYIHVVEGEEVRQIANLGL